MRAVVATLFLSICGLALADGTELLGPNRFPQFRDMSGLTGSGFAVDANGFVTTRGAISLSTPIGYTLASGKWAVGFASRSHNSKFAFINSDNATANKSDGTGQIMRGWKVGNGNMALSSMWLSTELDSVQHIQWSPYITNDQAWGWSVGIHNWTQRGHAAGDSNPAADAKNSLSVFFATTKMVGEDNYLTLGVGTTRYKGLFGSYCHQLTDRSKFFIENDTFNFNYGLSYGIPMKYKSFDGADAHLFLTAGFVRGKLATWTFNYTF
ncbi:MAG TPA: hypothetical protein VK171_08395 [Fimbriimonas sp.]|nr:hypothetical protein [Fimbriimonas sp.]